MTQCVVSLLPVTVLFPLKVRTWYAAWVEWVASERKEPSAGAPLLTPRSFSYALVGPVWTSCSLGRYTHFIAFAHTDNVIVDLFSFILDCLAMFLYFGRHFVVLQYFYSVFVPVDS